MVQRPFCRLSEATKYLYPTGTSAKVWKLNISKSATRLFQVFELVNGSGSLRLSNVKLRDSVIGYLANTVLTRVR